MPEDTAKRIAALNDRFRKEPTRYGKAYVTDGVEALGDEFRQKALHAVATFDSFSADNDPYGEHDFGAIIVDGERLFWKIDYYSTEDPDLGSEDPSDESRTARVMTIMLAEEY